MASVSITGSGGVVVGGGGIIASAGGAGGNNTPIELHGDQWGIHKFELKKSKGERA